MSAHEEIGQHVEGAPHASMKEYMIGFSLSVILTVIPFWLVLGDVIDSRGMTIFLIIVFGIMQMFVHMVYFLHLNTKSEGGWVLISLAFTVMLVVIAIAGSIWIMYHLDLNMMPTMQM
ncbi:MAG TPA: cytochrome o ubiquinol oxidase subunit IV [Cycloclasticus sp.]|jgi:cytochrome o ubiquinol oxidase operon protein cyoD|nr:cytochrome o ubiquinol oxidase subunit IV [Cycloclasticus sp.]